MMLAVQQLAKSCQRQLQAQHAEGVHGNRQGLVSTLQVGSLAEHARLHPEPAIRQEARMLSMAMPLLQSVIRLSSAGTDAQPGSGAPPQLPAKWASETRQALAKQGSKQLPSPAKLVLCCRTPGSALHPSDCSRCGFLALPAVVQHSMNNTAVAVGSLHFLGRGGAQLQGL